MIVRLALGLFSHAAEAENYLFFKFVQLKEPKPEDKIRMSFWIMLDAHKFTPDMVPDDFEEPGGPLPWPFFIKAQVRCMEEFFEKLRLASGPELAEKAIPTSLQISNLDVSQWCLGCQRVVQPIHVRNPTESLFIPIHSRKQELEGVA